MYLLNTLFIRSALGRSVRLAIGASPADVLRLVLRESLGITVVGLTLGLGLAMPLGVGLRAAIYQISPFDPVALGAATGIIAIASLAASILPARRARTFFR